MCSGVELNTNTSEKRKVEKGIQESLIFKATMNFLVLK